MVIVEISSGKSHKLLYNFLLAWLTLTHHAYWFWESVNVLHNSNSEQHVGRHLFEFNKQDVGINVFCPDVVGLKVLAEVVISRTVDTCYSYAWFGGLEVWLDWSGTAGLQLKICIYTRPLNVQPSNSANFCQLSDENKIRWKKVMVKVFGETLFYQVVCNCNSNFFIKAIYNEYELYTVTSW